MTSLKFRKKKLLQLNNIFCIGKPDDVGCRVQTERIKLSLKSFGFERNDTHLSSETKLRAALEVNSWVNSSQIRFNDTEFALNKPFLIDYSNHKVIIKANILSLILLLEENIYQYRHFGCIMKIRIIGCGCVECQLTKQRT
jgi:hypothetical protein